GQVEELRGELGGAGGAAVGSEDVHGAHLASPFLLALRRTTRPPLLPGMAPLMRTRPRSASMACTVRFCTVTRSTPIRPAIFRPLNTRPGVAQPPMEPGERCLRCTPWLAR